MDYELIKEAEKVIEKNYRYGRKLGCFSCGMCRELISDYWKNTVTHSFVQITFYSISVVYFSGNNSITLHFKGEGLP
ncbi:hypothetical protein AADC60_15495 [Cytobacillus pseudoceanisediminis]|uniref:Uncharacterized protein n=1 Tax=Cytobacillus pseudoceanisediminis TaxID=3051614 RepID=A0ABZ2ZRA7_9BACI|nr:hypothetical protein [Cytobacillus oceanisediminis]